jgi:hypothetical protein
MMVHECASNTGEAHAHCIDKQIRRNLGFGQPGETVKKASIPLDPVLSPEKEINIFEVAFGRRILFVIIVTAATQVELVWSPNTIIGVAGSLGPIVICVLFRRILVLVRVVRSVKILVLAGFIFI